MSKREQEQRLAQVRDLLALPGVLVATVAPSGRYGSVPAELAHVPALPCPGISLLDVVILADRRALIEAWEKTRATGGASAHVRIRQPDERTVELTFVDLRPSLGCYVAILLPSSQQLPAPLPHVPVPEPTMGPRLARMRKSELALFTDIDEATTELLGWTRDDLMGTRSLDLVHPDDQELAVASWMELLGIPGIGRRVRLRHRRKDGSYASFEVTNYNLLDDPEQACVLAEIVDISAEMEAHEALRAREQLMDRLAEALPVGVLQLAADGRVAYRNTQLVELLATETTTLAEVIDAVWPSDRARLADALGGVLAGRDHAQEHVRLDGPLARFCSVVARRLEDDTGLTTGAVLCLTDVTADTHQRQELTARVTVDPLTGALNRAGLDAVLQQACERARIGVAVLFVDIDRFKQVNDELGHLVGDAVLMAVANDLRENCRPGDVVGRLGGDEFLVVCTDVNDRGAAAVMERVRAAMGSSRSVQAGVLAEVSAAVGYAWSPAGAASATELVARADAAMYEAKAAGRALLPATAD